MISATKVDRELCSIPYADNITRPQSVRFHVVVPCPELSQSDIVVFVHEIVGTDRIATLDDCDLTCE